jgi:hypothetical protein
MLLLNLIPLIDVTFSTPTPDNNSCELRGCQFTNLRDRSDIQAHQPKGNREMSKTICLVLAIAAGCAFAPQLRAQALPNWHHYRR